MTEYSHEIDDSQPDHIKIKIAGSLQAGVQLPEMSLLGQASFVTIDLSGIDFINSSGVKAWVIFVTGLDELSIEKMTLKGIPVKMLEIFNMVAGCIPKNKVCDSFYIPLYCEKCDNEYLILRKLDEVDSNAEIMNSLKSSEINCETFPKCLNSIELDITLDKYLDRLK